MLSNQRRIVLTSVIKPTRLSNMVRTIVSTAFKAENNLKYEWRNKLNALKGASIRERVKVIKQGLPPKTRFIPKCVIRAPDKEAVKTLNTLQTNAQTLEKIRQSRDKYAHLNIPRMIKFAERVGIEMADMDRLNVIHVSGTKGKGSTCAYCESILRHHGYKTGFFSSPHLVEVRERFCVDGSPLEREKFATYFWEVYNLLEKSKTDHNGDMPNYFGFLTVMALHVFLKEKVDVAIMEVGIGGQYDSTNLLRKPVVCGVSSLGIDHTSILGTTVDKIAWHKAGIFKKDVPAFTVKQAPEAMAVIQQRARELGAPLSVCPDLQHCGTLPTLGIQGSVQKVNASLALQLCHTWISKQSEIRSKSHPTEVSVQNGHSGDKEESVANGTADPAYCDIQQASPVHLSQEYLNGLKNCRWLGRNQTISWPGITFYLDGAHTVESVQQCVDWFRTQSEKEASKHRVIHKVLIFNTTGDRDTSSLLTPLMSCQFNSALFCPNIAYETAMSADQTNNTVTKESQCGRCHSNKQTWKELTATAKAVNGGETDSEASRLRCSNRTTAEMGTNSIGHHGNQSLVETFASIEDCINWVVKRNGLEQTGSGDVLTCSGHLSEFQDHGESVIKKPKLDSENNNVQNGDLGTEHKACRPCIQVLITGSIHLVGGALRVIWDKDGRGKDVIVE